MAKSLLRVHEHLLLLTSDTSKGAAGPAFIQLIAHPRLPGVLPSRVRNYSGAICVSIAYLLRLLRKAYAMRFPVSYDSPAYQRAALVLPTTWMRPSLFSSFINP